MIKVARLSNFWRTRRPLQGLTNDLMHEGSARLFPTALVVAKFLPFGLGCWLFLRGERVIRRLSKLHLGLA